jgi:hypothetical protein
MLRKIAIALAATIALVAAFPGQCREWRLDKRALAARLGFQKLFWSSSTSTIPAEIASGVQRRPHDIAPLTLHLRTKAFAAPLMPASWQPRCGQRTVMNSGARR